MGSGIAPTARVKWIRPAEYSINSSTEGSRHRYNEPSYTWPWPVKVFTEKSRDKQVDKQPCGAAETWLSDRISSHRFNCGLHFPSHFSNTLCPPAASPELSCQIAFFAEYVTSWIRSHMESLAMDGIAQTCAAERNRMLLGFEVSVVRISTATETSDLYCIHDLYGSLWPAPEDRWTGHNL